MRQTDREREAQTVDEYRYADTDKTYTVIHNIHCESKKHATLHSCITSAYVDRFSKLFHCWIQQRICNKTPVMFPTTPYICCYTTLGNVHVQIIPFSGSKHLQKPIASSTKQLMTGAKVFVGAFERKDTLSI